MKLIQRAVSLIATGATVTTAVLMVNANSAGAISAPIHTTTTVNLRTGPSTDNAVVTTIPSNTSPDFVCWQQSQNISGVDVWFKVNYGGSTGFFASYYDSSSYPIDSAITGKYGIPQCGSIVVASAPVPPTSFNGHNVGYPQNGWHGWGNCTVRDYKGGEFDWTIVSTTAGTHIVHNGMLWGWFDNSGAPGSLGCPTSDEYGWNEGVRQDFQGGSMYWHPGMNRAVRTSSSALTAIDWADAHKSDGEFQGWCLKFVLAAYSQANVDLGAGWPADYSADYYARYSKHVLDKSTNPPPGAVVLWSGTPDYPDGHVALSIGGGYAISTTERDYPSGHIMSIAERNQTKPYAGWFMP